MNMLSFTMGQTENEDFPATASAASQPLNFAHQDFNPSKVASQSPHKQRSPGREQPGRPSTPFPENEVQFVPTFHTMASDHQPLDGIVHDNPDSVDSSYSAPDAMGATPTLNQANLCFSGHSGDALHHQPHQQQPGPLFFSQEQAWPPESHKLYYSQSLDLDSSALHRTNPFVTGQRSASCDASQGSTTPTSPVEKEERIPNSAVRRSRVWKYGRRSSGNHSDRQPFTFSVTASQAGGAIGGIDHSSTRYFGKRSLSNSSTRHDDSWSYEPTTKQFISEERMTAEMHNLSLDGVARQPMIPPPSSSTPSSPSLASSNFSSAPNMNLPSTSGQCNHGNSSNLLRHHRCHHNHRSRSYAEAVLADIERRLDNDSDDEGVEEDMPPNQGNGHRLEMTPQLVTALKCKGTSSHMLPQDIVKKIVSSPCMDLVLWRPLSILNPRLGPDVSSSSGSLSPSSSGGSELAPIMEVEVERERAEASSMMQQPNPYEGILPAAGDIMQEESLPDFDEDMDL